MERTGDGKDERSRGNKPRATGESTGAHKLRGQPGHTSSAEGARITGSDREDQFSGSSSSSSSPPLATVAALSGSLFAKLNVKDAVPRSWIERAKKAVEYYQEEPMVSNAINAWLVFALGDEITVGCEDEEIGKEARETFDRLTLNRFVKDMILQLLVKGDMIGYFNRNDLGNDIARVTCVNPVSVELTYENDSLAHAVQRPQRIDGSFGQPVDLSLDQMIHTRWNAPEFEPRGNSMVLPAFESIEMLRDYRKAERAIAKRWTSPLRFIQVGGFFGGRLITPSQEMIQDIRNELNRTNLKEGMVVPFYVKAETYGAGGKTLKTEGKIRDVKEDIPASLPSDGDSA